MTRKVSLKAYIWMLFVTTILIFMLSVKGRAAEVYKVRLPIIGDVQYSYDKRYSFSTEPAPKHDGTITVEYEVGERVYVKIDAPGQRYYCFEKEVDGIPDIISRNSGEDALVIQDGNIYSFMMPRSDVELKVFSTRKEAENEIERVLQAKAAAKEKAAREANTANTNQPSEENSNLITEATANEEDIAADEAVEAGDIYAVGAADDTDGNPSGEADTVDGVELTQAESGTMLLPVDTKVFEDSIEAKEKKWEDVSDVLEQLKKCLEDGIYFDVTNTDKFEIEDTMKSAIYEKSAEDGFDGDDNAYYQTYEVIIEDKDGSPCDFDKMSGYLTFENREMQEYFNDYGVKVFVNKDDKYEELVEQSKPSNTEDEIVVYEYNDVSPVFILSIDKKPPVEDDIEPASESVVDTPESVGEGAPEQTETQAESQTEIQTESYEEPEAQQPVEGKSTEDSESTTTWSTTPLGETNQENGDENNGSNEQNVETETTENKPSEEKTDSKDSEDEQKQTGWNVGNSEEKPEEKETQTETSAVSKFVIKFVDESGNTVKDVKGFLEKDGIKIEEISSDREEYDAEYRVGNYSIHLTDIPEGYKMNDSFDFKVEDEKKAEPVTIVLEKSDVQIECFSAKDSQNAINCEMVILDSEGNVVYDGGSGDSVKGLPAGEYTLLPKNSVGNFIETEGEKFVLDGHENNKKISLTLTPISVSVKVVDKETKDEISDFLVEFKSMETSFMLDEAAKEQTAVMSGEYDVTVKEISQEYRLPESRRIEVSNKEESQEVVIEAEKTALYIGRVDTNNSMVSGCTIEVRDKNNTVVDTWETTDSLHKLNGLKAGTYVIKETKTPENIEKPDDVKVELTQENKEFSVILGAKAPAKQGIKAFAKDILMVAIPVVAAFVIAIICLAVALSKSKKQNKKHEKEEK